MVKRDDNTPEYPMSIMPKLYSDDPIAPPISYMGSFMSHIHPRLGITPEVFARAIMPPKNMTDASTLTRSQLISGR